MLVYYFHDKFQKIVIFNFEEAHIRELGYIFFWRNNFSIINIYIYRKTPHIVVPRTDRTFLFFLGVTSGILCATVYFFFNYFGSIFTQFRPGHRPQKSIFWIFFRYFIAILYRDYLPKYHLKIDFEQLLKTFIWHFNIFSSPFNWIFNKSRTKIRFKKVFLEKLKMFGNRAPLISHKKILFK